MIYRETGKMGLIHINFISQFDWNFQRTVFFLSTNNMAGSLLGFFKWQGIWCSVILQFNKYIFNNIYRFATLHLNYYVYGKYMNIEAHIHIEDKLFCTSIPKSFPKLYHQNRNVWVIWISTEKSYEWMS